MRSNTNNIRQLPSILIKASIVMLGLLGQAISFRRMGSNPVSHFFYYTNLSNILVMALSLFTLLAMLRGRHLPGWLGKARFAFSAGILLTFVGFSLLLAPRQPASYLFSPDNLLVHNLVPLLACIDFLLFDEGLLAGRLPALGYGLCLPGGYLPLVFSLGLGSIRFQKGAVVPYFFLDYQQNGWLGAGDGKLGVFWWLLLILVFQLSISWMLKGLKTLVISRRQDAVS